MASNGATLNFAPVETGDMSEIPPDAPDGLWTGVAKVTEKVSKSGRPMLQIDWRLEEAQTDGNEDFVGAKVTDWLVFFGKGDAGLKMGRQKLKDLCAATKIEVPSVQSLRTFEDIRDFITELNGCKASVWTRNKTDKDGTQRTEILYAAPSGAKMTLGGAADDDEDDEPAPAAKKGSAKKGSKK